MEKNEQSETFRLGYLSVMIAVKDVGETEPKTPENSESMAALMRELRSCLDDGTLVGVCQNAAAMAVGGIAIRNEFFKNSEKVVTLRDIRILHAGLKEIAKELEGPDKEKPSPELITVRKALARVNYVVSLVYAVLHGGPFYYQMITPGKNEIPEIQRKVKYFRGIPEDLWPKRDDGKVNYRISPENMKKIYETLLSLEEKGTAPAEGLSIREKIQRARQSRQGEAQFFWERLPAGLKEPRIAS